MPPVVKAKVEPVKVALVDPDEVEPDEPDEVEPDEPEDPNAQYIVYREPIVNQVDVPGVGPTAVRSYKEHRVLLSEWPAYELALIESKKGL